MNMTKKKKKTWFEKWKKQILKEFRNLWDKKLR